MTDIQKKLAARRQKLQAIEKAIGGLAQGEDDGRFITTVNNMKQFVVTELAEVDSKLEHARNGSTVMGEVAERSVTAALARNKAAASRPNLLTRTKTSNR